MNIELTELSNGPVYLQVREQLRNQIDTRKIPSGETLPAPALLAKKLSCDKGEILRAYFELEQSGLIRRETGKDFLGHAKTTYRVA